MRSPRLAALELRRFGRGKLPRLGLVALMLIPLLYGALYLCSFWDPYSRLDKIPVAIVNNDEGSSADGKKINAGEELAGNVTDSKTFHWEEVSAAEAAKGVEDGTYYLSLTVPKNFSERIASSSGDSPQTGALQVRTNDANNYIVGSISKTVFSEIRAKTSAKSSRAFLDKIFVSFSDLHDRTAEAADGASKLDDGLDDAKKGSGKLADGLGTAKDSTGKLSGGLGKLDKGSGDLSKGAGDTHRGAKTLEEKLGLAHSKIEELSQGTRQVAAGTQKLADTANGLAGKARPFLKQYAKDLGEKARIVAGASGALADDLGTLPRDTARASSEAREAADQLDTLYDQRCGSAVSLDADCPALKKARDATALAADTAEKVNSLVASHTSGIDKLTGDLRRLDKVATAVADRAPTSEKDLETAVAEINRLNAGAHKVSDGAGKIATGTGQLTDGAGRLTDGTGRVADGAGQMHDGIGAAKNGTDQLEGGIGKLKDGAVSLNGGLFKLKDGSNQLAEGLHNGVAKIPDYDKHDREARTEVMADPVEPGLEVDAQGAQLRHRPCALLHPALPVGRRDGRVHAVRPAEQARPGGRCPRLADRARLVAAGVRDRGGAGTRPDGRPALGSRPGDGPLRRHHRLPAAGDGLLHRGHPAAERVLRPGRTGAHPRRADAPADLGGRHVPGADQPRVLRRHPPVPADELRRRRSAPAHHRRRSRTRVAGQHRAHGLHPRRAGAHRSGGAQPAGRPDEGSAPGAQPVTERSGPGGGAGHGTAPGARPGTAAEAGDAATTGKPAGTSPPRVCAERPPGAGSSTPPSP